MIVVGLENTGDPRAKALAFNLAQKWLINNYDAYQESMPNAMFEKVRETIFDNSLQSFSSMVRFHFNIV